LISHCTYSEASAFSPESGRASVPACGLRLLEGNSMRTVLNDSVSVMVLLCAVAVGANTASACTGIRLKAKDGAVIYARSLEFATNLQSNVLVIPRNMKFTGTTLGGDAGIHWQTKYAMVGANAFNMPQISDGLNEKGLAVGIFYMPGFTKYQAVDAAHVNNSLASWELPLYLLSNCATVKEAVAAARGVLVSDVTLKDIDFIPTFHYVVHDADGHSAVLEYTNGELKVYDDPLGVVTNAPTFDWQMTNLGNYVNLRTNNVASEDMGGVKISAFGQGSGMLGLPGDFTPPSRFVRAVAFSQSALPVETALEGVLQAFHILNQFDIPKGSARTTENGKTWADYTMWTSASDLKNHRYYFHTFENRRIRMVDLGKMDLNAKDIKTFPMNQQEAIEDLSNNPLQHGDSL
jgi:choloylglycine hydrolase